MSRFGIGTGNYTNQEVEAMAVPELVKAIYPVLIPVEQQDMRTQQRNHERMTFLATNLWRAFRDLYKPCPPHMPTTKSEGERAWKVCQKCGKTLRELPVA